METLDSRLSALAASGVPITFPAIALPAEQVRDQTPATAAGPYAGFLAEAVVHAIDNDDHVWDSAATAFPGGLAEQASLLHLTSALEALLASPRAAKTLGKPLTQILLEDLTASAESTPYLAAARLEGAVRLAVSDAVPPFRVWSALEDLTPDGPEEFLERLPRILGVALDHWSRDEAAVADTARTLLSQLASTESCDVDAFVELGIDLVRQALAAESLTKVSDSFSAARAWFHAANAADTTRHDASSYAAVCDAVLAFTARDATALTNAAQRLAAALDQRHAWLHGMHQPAWLRPQLAADIAWERLVERLNSAASALADDVWMDPWTALSDVLSAYQAARTVRPLGIDGPGLALLIEPAVHDTFIERQALLAQLRRAATGPNPHPALQFDAVAANALVAAVDQQIARSAPTASRETTVRAEDANPDDGATEADLERVQRYAPTTVRKLGASIASDIARLPDESLKAVEGLVQTEELSRLRNSDPVVVPLLNEVISKLTEFEGFVGDTRRTFTLLVEQTLLFMRAAADLTTVTAFGEGRTGPDGKKIRIRDYRRQFRRDDGDSVPLESELQQHYHYWLLSGVLYGLVQVEPINVALGRADVMVHFGSRRYLTEIKKDHDDRRQAALELKYRAQTAEYSNTNVPFGQLLVLDLTEKDKQGTPRLDEAVWVFDHQPPETTVKRAVVAGIVTGNRRTPHDFS